MKSEIRSVVLPGMGKGQVRVRSVFSLISQGTEKTVSLGKVPEDMFDRMKVPYMQGGFDFPIKYAYSLVGQIIGEHEFSGRYVHLMHPHQDICQVDMKDTFELSDRIHPKRAVLLSNMETVINAIWDGDPSPGDRVIIFGFGSIGALLATTLANFHELDLSIFEPSLVKQKSIKSFGFKLCTPSELESSSFNMAYNCTGNGEALQLAINSVGFEGKVIETSWYGNTKVNLNLGGSFHYDRKRIISSQVSSIPGNRKNEWDFIKRKEYAQKLLEDPSFDLLLDHEISLDDAAEYFENLRNRHSSDHISTIINYAL